MGKGSIDLLTQEGKDLAHLDSALTAAFELERRSQQFARLSLRRHATRRQGLAIVSGQGGFGIEGVDLGRATGQKELDDMLGPGRREPS